PGRHSNFATIHGKQKTVPEMGETAATAWDRAAVYYNYHNSVGEVTTGTILYKRYWGYKELYAQVSKEEYDSGSGLFNTGADETYQEMLERICPDYERFDQLLHNNPNVRPLFEMQLTKSVAKGCSRTKEVLVKSSNVMDLVENGDKDEGNEGGEDKVNEDGEDAGNDSDERSQYESEEDGESMECDTSNKRRGSGKFSGTSFRDHRSSYPVPSTSTKA
ncbi:hypothetical protein BGX27_006014, partial [Mortierella sp. AM989]